MRHIYFNLHKRGWSIKNPRTGLVENKGHPTPCLILENVTFKVREAAIGNAEFLSRLDKSLAARPVRINPLKAFCV